MPYVFVSKISLVLFVVVTFCCHLMIGGLYVLSSRTVPLITAALCIAGFTGLAVIIFVAGSLRLSWARFLDATLS